MTTKATWTLETLEQMPWAQAFKKEAPVSYATAMRYALEDRLQVFIEHTTESGEPQWVIRVLDDPSFWMDAVPTKTAAIQISREMGWKIVR
ncbi:MAG: hypothetical protein KKB95_01440 [Gammaproteobacteria bacterium]|nr:hypothetical protein [Gammaproteobacteria bacterium]MBU1504538.1 hypothetical protein [Gammaproteobacteria bacterium]MBU2119400.1 hypothetical protein [Gammaproteobacteria bacterium]MBU2202833.1 hypothetical protein [Gammaproteobacteria bacterium]MBU2272572.1 hypothetical protein [Gammaproteobacteria bacterium]